MTDKQCDVCEKFLLESLAMHHSRCEDCNREYADYYQGKPFEHLHDDLQRYLIKTNQYNVITDNLNVLNYLESVLGSGYKLESLGSLEHFEQQYLKANQEIIQRIDVVHQIALPLRPTHYATFRYVSDNIIYIEQFSVSLRVNKIYLAKAKKK